MCERKKILTLGSSLFSHTNFNTRNKLQYDEMLCYDVLLHSKMCFFYCYFYLDVLASLYRMMYVWTLTLEGCFYIHLLKVESFSVANENQIFSGGPLHDL